MENPLTNLLIRSYHTLFSRTGQPLFDKITTFFVTCHSGDLWLRRAMNTSWLRGMSRNVKVQVTNQHPMTSGMQELFYGSCVRSKA